MIWQTARHAIDLTRPRVMGIVNLTPDSFSDGGRCADTGAALRHCERLIRDGADILDLGAESTRPGSEPVSADLELARLLPVLRAASAFGVAISVDTSKAAVMRAALDLGADIINDVCALRQPGALAAVAAHPRCGVCLMHMHRDPRSMQASTMQGDVLPQVLSFLQQSAQRLRAHGVDKARIVVDPGIGFGKTAAQNFALLAQQRALLAAGYPLLVGWSRKSSLGAVSGLAVDERLAPSVAAALLAAQRGAAVLRVHDVRATVAALAVWRAVCDADADAAAAGDCPPAQRTDH